MAKVEETHKEQVEKPTNIDIIESPEALQEQLSKTEQFVKKNRNIVIGVAAGIVLLVSAAIFYRWNTESQNKEAQVEMFPAVFYLEKDSVQKALKGDNNTTKGLLYVAKEYSGTKAANLANFYIGVAKMKEGKFDEAITYLENFNADDLLLQARVYALIGDAYMEKNNVEQAVNYYEKAADYKPNEYYTPAYLMKLGLAYEMKKDFAAAIKVYQDVKDNYKDSPENATAVKQVARLEQTQAK